MIVNKGDCLLQKNYNLREKKTKKTQQNIFLLLHLNELWKSRLCMWTCVAWKTFWMQQQPLSLDAKPSSSDLSCGDTEREKEGGEKGEEGEGESLCIWVFSPQ